jgi:hypothetical protein
MFGTRTADEAFLLVRVMVFLFSLDKYPLMMMMMPMTGLT